MYELITKYFYGEITAKEKKLLFTAMETDAELKKRVLICSESSYFDLVDSGRRGRICCRGQAS